MYCYNWLGFGKTFLRSQPPGDRQRGAFAAAIAVTALMMFAAPASAATMLSTTGTPLTETVKNSPSGDGTS